MSSYLKVVAKTDIYISLKKITGFVEKLSGSLRLLQTFYGKTSIFYKQFAFSSFDTKFSLAKAQWINVVVWLVRPNRKIVHVDYRPIRLQ